MSSDRPTKTVKYALTTFTLCTTDQQIPTSNKNSKENDIFCAKHKSQYYIQTIWCNEVLITFIQLFFDHCYSIV
jgi:hypothetical protein